MSARVLLAAAVAIALIGCSSVSDDWSSRRIGYLSSQYESARLLAFDADTFEELDRVDLPVHYSDGAHRLEVDAEGRIWIGFDQFYISPTLFDLLTGRRPRRNDVLVLDSRLRPFHTFSDVCRSPRGGIAFEGNKAYVGCDDERFTIRLVELDLTKPEMTRGVTVERLGEAYAGPSRISTVESVAGKVLVSTSGDPPHDYQSKDDTLTGVSTTIDIFDPKSMQASGSIELAPGSVVYDMAEVNGKVWLFNTFGHVTESPTRVDVHILDVDLLELVDSVNLPKAYPVWGEVKGDKMYIFHNTVGRFGGYGSYERTFAPLTEATDGPEIGFTVIDLPTMEMEYSRLHVDTDGLDEAVFYDNIEDAAVLDDKFCLALDLRKNRRSGLWCDDGDGVLKHRIHLYEAVGVIFP